MATPLKWTSNTEFSVGDLRFRCVEGEYEARSGGEDLILLKNRLMIERQLAFYRLRGVKRAFEFGIFQGGSALLLTEALGLERMAALDMSDPVESVDKLIRARNLSDRIRLNYNVSQNSPTKVTQILSDAFVPGELDLIIDDASHLYSLSLASFEMSFPFLRRGGIYVIEDWGWAHWPGYWQTEEARWRDEPALTNLIFELTMAVASRQDAFDNISIYPTFAVLQKGPRAPISDKPFKLDEYYRIRGKQLPMI